MYLYSIEKQNVFTDEGQKKFLKIRDHVQACLKKSGAVRMQEAMIGGGSSWTLLACVDRMVELGEIREIEQPGTVAGQHRIFVAVE